MTVLREQMPDRSRAGRRDRDRLGRQRVYVAITINELTTGESAEAVCRTPRRELPPHSRQHFEPKQRE